MKPTSCGTAGASHQEFLAESDADPRRRFAETLIAALSGTRWPIIVYSSYEKTQLTELARIFPDLRRPVAGIVRRLLDLLPVVRDEGVRPRL